MLSVLDAFRCALPVLVSLFAVLTNGCEANQHWMNPNDNFYWKMTLDLNALMWRAECHFSEAGFFGISELRSSKPETRKVCSLIKAGKAFQRNGAPDRCREQTGRLQLYVDEVAHKMGLLSSWLILVCDEDKLNFNPRANFYPKANRHEIKKRLQIP